MRMRGEEWPLHWAVEKTWVTLINGPSWWVAASVELDDKQMDWTGLSSESGWGGLQAAVLSKLDIQPREISVFPFQNHMTCVDTNLVQWDWLCRRGNKSWQRAWEGEKDVIQGTRPTQLWAESRPIAKPSSWHKHTTFQNLYPGFQASQHCLIFFWGWGTPPNVLFLASFQ